MALDLSKVKERGALRSQREPYWQRIRPGCFLGYRPSAREGAGHGSRVLMTQISAGTV